MLYQYYFLFISQWWFRQRDREYKNVRFLFKFLSKISGDNFFKTLVIQARSKVLYYRKANKLKLLRTTKKFFAKMFSLHKTN